MQLTPRYGDDPVITLDGPPDAVLAPTVRQRRRLLDALDGLDATGWDHPSRCEGWTTRDVVVHLDTATRFWNLSIEHGVQGRPTRFLATFDPVATPLALVAGSELDSPAAALESYRTSSEAYLDLLGSLGHDGWEALAEGPPGHISVAALAHHGLWDAWVHERDVLLPLGIVPDVEADEVAASLRYVAALGPGFARLHGATGTGTLGVAVDDLVDPFTVHVGHQVEVRTEAVDGADLVLGGPALDLLEALSFRAPMAQEVPSEQAWLLRGLDEVFDQPI